MWIFTRVFWNVGISFVASRTRLIKHGLPIGSNSVVVLTTCWLLCVTLSNANIRAKRYINISQHSPTNVPSMSQNIPQTCPTHPKHVPQTSPTPANTSSLFFLKGSWRVSIIWISDLHSACRNLSRDMLRFAWNNLHLLLINGSLLHFCLFFGEV